jgi:LEA14-like dessication related protein
MYFIYSHRSSTKMNKSAIYSGVGVSATAIIIFAFLGNGSFSRVLINQDEKTAKDNSITTSFAAAAAASPAANVAPIDLKIKNVVVNKTNDEKSANVQVAFDVRNPNTNTMILDGIRYNVYVNNALITSDNIGTEAPEDVIRSESGFPIIGNSVVSLKDTQAVQKNNINAASWDKVVAGAAATKTSYLINGTYSYRQTANLEASGGVKEFSLTFP